MKMFYEQDVKMDALKGKKVAILGYGSQGHAHAQNLRDSGVDVVVGLHDTSKSIEKAKNDGFEVVSVADATKMSDIVMCLMPDTAQKKIYDESIKENLREGQTLAFAHGFNIHYNLINPPEFVDVIMVAPKGPGHLLRSVYKEGSGVPCLFAVYKDATGHARDTVLAYAKGIGGTRAGVLETTFKEETETDLFGEQAVLCGGCEELIKAGANFASSPKRINIHALDPAIIAAKMSLSDTTKDIDLKAILDNTKYGSAGMGGIKTKGTMYVGYPR